MYYNFLAFVLFQAHEDNDLDNHTDTDSGISDIENLGSPFSQNSGGQSPQHEPSPHSPCPSSTAQEGEGEHPPHNGEVEGEGRMCPYDSHVASSDITKIDDDTAELMEFEDVIRDVASRHVEDNTNAIAANAQSADFQNGGLGFQEFQDFYDSELVFDGDSGGAQIVEFGPEYGPEIPEELAGTGIPDLEDHGAIQYELMHMDEQLMNLDYNIEDLDEAFLKMDEEIAKTISEDEPMINDGFNDIFDSTVDVSNAWVDHQAYADIPELLELNAAASTIGPIISPIKDSFHQSQGEELLNEEADPNFDITSLDKLEAMDESLENFDLGLLEGSSSVLDSLEDGRNVLVSLDDSEEDILRNDVLLSHSLHAEVARDNSDNKNNLHSQVFLLVKNLEF